MDQEELALIYQSKGLDEKTAKELATNLMQQSNTALDTLAREELGIDASAAVERGLLSTVSDFPQHCLTLAWYARTQGMW